MSDRMICDAFDGWRSTRVTLDGEDVNHRCRAIVMEGERPVKLWLYVHDGAGQCVLNEAGDDVVREWRTGEITVEGLRRCEESHL